MVITIEPSSEELKAAQVLEKTNDDVEREVLEIAAAHLANYIPAAKDKLTAGKTVTEIQVGLK
jgi:hypothetical protein